MMIPQKTKVIILRSLKIEIALKCIQTVSSQSVFCKGKKRAE